MSLNGLDDAKVTEAYQSSLAEAGGWFLLKYASRDEVEIYKRGSGGVPEARIAIAEYTDKSPLYGFLVYRRRKVLVKYIPDGTSRLLQARVTVHFQSFEDKFTPHDTVIIIASSIELTDAALTAACSLHSAAESTRSSGGSAQHRKSKLDEIVEDPKERPSYDARAAQEEKPFAPSANVPAIIETGPTDATSKALPDLPIDSESRPGTRESFLPNPPLASRKAAAILGIPLSSVSSVSIESSTQRPVTPHIPGDTASLYAASISSVTRSDYLAYLEGVDTRPSTSTARPSLSDIYSSSIYVQKPKVKLGPRPSVDGASKATAGPRPISSLPPGLKAAPRRELHSSNRPTSRHSRLDPSIKLPPPPPIPETPQMPTYVRPGSSPASVRSLPATLAGRSDKMTPEKKRLMKAMEMRKKQLAAAKNQDSIPKTIEKEAQPEPEVPRALKISKAAIVTDLVRQDHKDAVEQPMSSSSPEVQEKEPEPEQPTTVEELPVMEETLAKSEEPPQVTTIEPPPKIDDPTPQEGNEAQSEPLSAPLEENVVRNPSRASGDHLKADSGVEIEVSKPQIETEDEHPPPASASSPISMEHSSELPSTRPSSISETGEEGTIADVWAEDAKEEDIPDHHSQETISAATAGAPQVELLAAPTLPELSPTSVKERAEELRQATQAEASSSEEADAASDTTPTERSIVHTSDNHLTLTLPERKSSMLESRRRGMIRQSAADPQMHFTPDESEVDMSDDDLMSELQNAEVQEAKPVQVSKNQSPTIFPTLKATTVTATSPRSASNPTIPARRPSGRFRSDSEQSLDKFARSANNARVPERQGTISVAKKVNISSGISQRIKALARNSNPNEPASVDRIPSRDSSGPSIVALRKSSLGNSTPPSRPQSSSTTSIPTTRDRIASLSRNAPTTFDDPSSSGTTTPQPRDSIHTVYNVQQRSDRPQSISVSARIVRDFRLEKPEFPMPAQSAPLELHESPLIIEHKKTKSEPKLESTVDKKPEGTPGTTSTPTSPIQEHAALSPSVSLPRTSSENWRSTIYKHARRVSESKSPSSVIKSSSETSLGTTLSRDSDSGTEKGQGRERKGSRSSRMLRRMSNSISLGRKTFAHIVSPTVDEEVPSAPLPTRVSEEDHADGYYSMEIGDLNVQLPDTLLWKRRWVEIDSDGNFVVKMSKSNEMANTKSITKTFHMSEFKRPFLPDQERQEMPNSVVLDFLDGRTMQCACETAGGQIEVLRLLQEAHQAYYSPSPS